MKKTNRPKKLPNQPQPPLSLNKETVRPLDTTDLQQASGGRSAGCYQ